MLRLSNWRLQRAPAQAAGVVLCFLEQSGSSHALLLWKVPAQAFGRILPDPAAPFHHKLLLIQHERASQIVLRHPLLILQLET